MPLSEPFIAPSFLAYLGAVVLLLGEIYALLHWRDLKRVLIVSTVAEIGFAIMGFALSEVGQLGAGMHILYQLAMRLLVVLCAFYLARRSGGWTIDKLRGNGRLFPLYGILFAFGMFSLLGLSPFKGALSRFLVLNELVGADLWFLAACATLASILASIYSISLIQEICFAKSQTGPIPASGTQTKSNPVFVALCAALGIATALLNFFPEPVAHAAGLLFGNHTHMPHVEGPWPVLSILPYAGAFVLLLIGVFSESIRNAVAVILAAAALGFVALSTGLDPISYLFALLFAFVMLAVVIYSVAYMDHENDRNLYYFFLFLMSGSLIGLAVASDLGSFYLFWELMTWSSYLLIVHTRSEEALAAGKRYFIMCVGGAYVMLMGIVWLAREAGSFEFSVLFAQAGQIDPATATIICLLLFVGFAAKGGFVPLHSWLPVAHPAAPSPISAPLSSILTKTAFLGTAKLLILALAMQDLYVVTLVISGLGLISLIYGEVMAWRQSDLKRMLAYSTVAQVGEIAALIGLATALSVASGFAHILTHGIMKTLLFLSAGALIYAAGSRQISDLAGLGKRLPITAFTFSLGLLAIMGLPPFAGFYSKFLMIHASIDAGAPLFAVLLLLGGLIGVLYYGRLIRVVLFDPAKEGGNEAVDVPWMMKLPIMLLALMLLAGGLMPDAFLSLAREAAFWTLEQPENLPSLDVTWPLATIICGVGAIASYLSKSAGRTVTTAVAVATMIAVIAALYWQRADFDALTFGFAMIISTLGLLNILYTHGYFDHHGHRMERFVANFLLMIGGLIGICRADDLFSFFFFWEIMSSWALYFAIAHEETSGALREGFKYFLFNMVGASFLFFGVATLAVGANDTSFEAVKLAAETMPLWHLVIGLGSALIGFAMKAAMITIRVDYQMHPATAPTPVSGYISAVLLKSGPLFAFKFLMLAGLGVLADRLGLLAGLSPLSYALVLVGCITALYAGMMALIQTGIKRLLIYSTVAQLGYVMCALALGDSLSVAGGLAHLANHALLKNTLFLGAGVTLAQMHVHSLDDVSGLARRMPMTFAMFLFAGLSLAGLPPFNGLGSKWMIYEGALLSGHPFVALMLMGASLTTLAAVLKFAHAAFMGTPNAASEKMTEAPWTMLLPMGLLSAASLAISLLPGLLLVPVARIQAAIGLEPIEATWLGGLPGPYGWHPLALLLPMLVVIGLGWLMLVLPSRGWRRTHAHTCGVSLNAEDTRLASAHLYATPDRLIRKVLFVQGEGK